MKDDWRIESRVTAFTVYTRSIFKCEWYFINNYTGTRRSQDGRIGGCRICLSSQVHQEYIYKWNNSQEQLLSISGRLWTPKRTRKIPLQPGRMKERKKEKRNQKRDQQPWWEAEGEERFLHSEKTPHGGEISWDTKVPSGESKEKAVDGLWKAGQSKNCTHGLCCSPVYPSLSRVLPVVKGGWVLENGAWSVDPERGPLLAVKRQPEGTGVRSSTTGNVCSKSLGHDKSKASLLSGMQGAGPPLQPLSPPASFFSLLGHWEGHPSEQAHPPLKPRPPKCRPSQCLLGNQPWAPLPEMVIHQCW